MDAPWLWLVRQFWGYAEYLLSVFLPRHGCGAVPHNAVKNRSSDRERFAHASGRKKLTCAGNAAELELIVAHSSRPWAVHRPGTSRFGGYVFWTATFPAPT